jgi:hypothetical protein
MVLIIIYLVFILVALLASIVASTLYTIPFVSNHQTLIYCIIAGGIGGVLYCLRGVYLNYCVRKNWDKVWHVWYIVRPIVSLISGGVSYIFLQAGLLILESSNKPGASHLAFYAFAFVAGLNVDKFIAKIEDFAHKTWGIEKSRSAGNTD